MAPKNQALEGQATKFALSLDDLKGKQSVRATFRLPKEAIDLLSVIAAQLGIKQKSLFDQLVEDSGILGQLATEARNYAAASREKHQKTFVISRSSLLSLDSIARQQRVPRDLLVEFSIKRLLPVISNEIKKHEKRKVLLAEMQGYLENGKRLLARAEELIGTEDEIYAMLRHQVKLCERNVTVINSIVERGKPMEEW